MDNKIGITPMYFPFVTRICLLRIMISIIFTVNVIVLEYGFFYFIL